MTKWYIINSVHFDKLSDRKNIIPRLCEALRVESRRNLNNVETAAPLQPHWLALRVRSDGTSFRELTFKKRSNHDDKIQ
jgi:hypothetical protein